MGHSPAPHGSLQSLSATAHVAIEVNALLQGDHSARSIAPQKSYEKHIAHDVKDGQMCSASDTMSDQTNEKVVEGELLKKSSLIGNISAEQNSASSNVNNGLPKVNGTSEKNPSKRKTRKASKYYCPYDLDERDFDENTPLHVAIHARKLDCVKLLLEAGANVHKKCDGSAPVHTAISIGAIPAHANFAAECLAVLINYGADLSVKDESMHTPLYLTAVCNLPRSASLILHDSVGLTTLNMRAERSGARPLHACAKFDKITQSSKAVVGATLQQAEMGCSAMLTRMFLSTPGIEVDPTNSYGRTPLHTAALRGNWAVARLLLQHGADPNALDQKGDTPGKLASKRGMVVPSDLLPQLGNSACQQRDLIMDPNLTTLIVCHELCSLHLSCAPISRGGTPEETDPPPENVRRLHVLISKETGILRSGEFSGCAWESEARRAAVSDVLKVHEYSYIEKISHICSALPDHPSSIAQIDPDTAVSHWSFEAAMRAAGAVCEAVDRVMAGDYRNAFCAIRPPGHHAGPRGVVTCPNDPDGSHGFCLLNNVAVGAAYARSMYRNDGIKKVAIIDFDVHHGNGTEEIVRQLVPGVEFGSIRTPFAHGALQVSRYRPWLDEDDVRNVFFASTHGYGPRDSKLHETSRGGWFYPASGASHVTESVRNPNGVEYPSLTAFLQTQTWTRMGDEVLNNCCKIIDIGLQLPDHAETPGMQRVDLRDAYRKTILPHLVQFKPDIIFISAGFDAHKRDNMNFGYVGMIEEDYEWLTEQLVKVANSCCNGRIVSVLEGGYKIHGGIVSPFARSVASHLRALADGGFSRETYNGDDLSWESAFERRLIEDKERKRQIKMDRIMQSDTLRRVPLRGSNAALKLQQQKHHTEALLSREPSESHIDVERLWKEPLHDSGLSLGGDVANPASETINDVHSNAEDTPQRKRRRNQVDYKALYEKMKKEGEL